MTTKAMNIANKIGEVSLQLFRNIDTNDIYLKIYLGLSFTYYIHFSFKFVSTINK